MAWFSCFSKILDGLKKYASANHETKIMFFLHMAMLPNTQGFQFIPILAYISKILIK